jgi:predicted enzyme related to lactoylglutathione lyase
MWSHGSFYWNELMTRNVEQAKRFYSSSIGWTFEPMPMPNGTYWIANMGDKPVAGIFPLSDPEFEGVPESWMSYLAVDDVDARAVRRSRCRTHRHSHRAGRSGNRLDHAGRR